MDQNAQPGAQGLFVKKFLARMCTFAQVSTKTDSGDSQRKRNIAIGGAAGESWGFACFSDDDRGNFSYEAIHMGGIHCTHGRSSAQQLQRQVETTAKVGKKL